jgi:hypothetical protein
MKKLIIATLVLLTTGAFAQQFVIKLDKERGTKPRQMSRFELEERMRYLEQAVWELQSKVFQLENKPVEIITPIRPPRSNEKAWYCEIELFSERFDAWGPTELEARTQVVNQCAKQYFRSSCSKDKVRCEANR